MLFGQLIMETVCPTGNHESIRHVPAENPPLNGCEVLLYFCSRCFSLSSCMEKLPGLELDQKREARQYGKVDVLKLFPLI